MAAAAGPRTDRRDLSIPALFVSVFCAAAASLAQPTVLGKQVYDLTGREIDLGFLGLAEFAPAALLVLVTGSIADRFDRRKVGAAACLAEAAVSGGLAWYAGTKPTSAGPIFFMVFGFGIARAFAAPATRALPSDIVMADRLPWVMARYSATWQVSIIVGPVLGGFLYAADVRLPYLAAMVLLVIAAISLAAVHVSPEKLAASAAARAAASAGRTEAAEADATLEAAVEPSIGHAAAAPTPTERPGWRDAIEGLRFIRHRPVLLGAI